MSSSVSFEFFDQSAASNGIRNIGFRPELYTVAAGTYASNGVYGVGADLVNSYKNIQLPRGTTTVPLTGASGPPFVTSTEGCDIRQHDNEVNFVCSITLDANPSTDPDLNTEELRIRPQRPFYNQPARYMLPFPLPVRGTQPVFEDVEIQNRTGAQVAPSVGVGAWVLEARLLVDGTLALAKRNTDTVGTQQTALTHDDIAGAFSTNDVISITMRGKYLAQSPRTGLPGAKQLYK